MFKKFVKEENCEKIINFVSFVKLAKVEKLVMFVKLVILVKLVKFVGCHLMKVSLTVVKRRLM